MVIWKEGGEMPRQDSYTTSINQADPLGFSSVEVDDDDRGIDERTPLFMSNETNGAAIRHTYSRKPSTSSSSPPSTTTFWRSDMEAAKETSRRVMAVDMLRGWTIVIMILVDDAGDIYRDVISHSPWNGITLADTVMPFFLWIVGLSMALSFKKFMSMAHDSDKASSTLVKKVVLRSLKLFLLGIILQGGGFPDHYDLRTLRIFGILQRIAIVYFVVSMMLIFLSQRTHVSGLLQVYKRYVYHWLVAGFILIIYLTIMFAVNVPNCGRASLKPECNSAGYVDRLVLGLHAYSRPTYIRSASCSSCPPSYCAKESAPSWCGNDNRHWPPLAFDPEGIVSSFSAILSTFLGLHFGLVMVHIKPSRQRIIQWFPLSLLLLILGLGVNYAGFPFNKNIWSTSYMLIMASACGFGLILCHVLVDLFSYGRVIFAPFVWIGMNSILIYVFAAEGVLDDMLQWIYYGDPSRNIYNIIRNGLIDQLGRDNGILVAVFIKILFWTLVAGFLHRRRIYWKI